MADDDKKNSDNGFAKVDDTAKAREAEVVAARQRAEQARDAAAKRAEQPAPPADPASDVRASAPAPKPAGVATDTQPDQAVRNVGFPEGLMKPRVDAQPDPGREISAASPDPMLVVHNGGVGNLSAPDEAAVHHFRMHMSELRNKLHGFNPKLLGVGTPMHALAVNLRRALHVRDEHDHDDE
jgi:hypothetical protein